MAEEVSEPEGDSGSLLDLALMAAGTLGFAAATVISEGIFVALMSVTFVAEVALVLFGLSQSPAREGEEGVSWWYRSSGFPWLGLFGLGLLSFPAVSAAIILGGVFRLPAALISVAQLVLIARWAAYRRRRAKGANAKDLPPQPETEQRKLALQGLDKDPAWFMRHQARGSGFGVFLGRGEGRWVFSEPEHSVMVIGPPRSGKTSGIVVPTILCCNGPLLCTSTKTDVLIDTVQTRRRLGTCWLFDPTGTVEVPDGVRRLTWSPLWGCEDWEHARAVAYAMVGASAAGVGVSNATHWSERAESLLGPLLHAAAVAGEDMATVVEWINRRELDEPRDILEGREPPQAESALVGMGLTHEEEMSGIWSTTAGVMRVYQSARALATTVLEDDQPRFHADRFVRSMDSIYVAANSDQQRLVAPLVVGLIDEVRRATYRAAAKGLEVPVLLALDEVRNIAPIKDLPSIVSEAGGQKLTVLACFQDLSQAQERWPTAARGFLSLFNTNVVLRGIKEYGTLELVSALFGEHEVTVESRTTPDISFAQVITSFRPGAPPPATGSTQTSPRRQRLVPVDAVSRGVPGQAIVMSGAEAPQWVRLDRAFASAPWKQIIGGEPGGDVAPYWVIHDEPTWQWDMERRKKATQAAKAAWEAEESRRATEAQTRERVKAEQAVRAQAARSAGRRPSPGGQVPGSPTD